MNPYNNYHHNPHRRYPNQQIQNNSRNNPNFRRNQINNYNYQNNHPNNHSNNHINNTHNQYNPNRYHNNYYNNKYNSNNSNHNNNYHSHHRTYNSSRNNNNNNRPIRSPPKPQQINHSIISKTTGPLIIQQKKQQEPYFYDKQRPIAKQAHANKSSIMNNPILDSNEKYRLILNDQICAIQKEQKLIENTIEKHIDMDNGHPVSPECSPDLTDNEIETDIHSENINNNINGIPNVKFGDIIEAKQCIIEYTKNYEMINENNDNLLDNNDNKEAFGIYSNKYVHKQAMLIPDKHTFGDCINNAMVINKVKSNKKNKKKGKKRRGGKRKNNYGDIGYGNGLNMSEKEKQDFRIHVEVNAFNRFLEEAKENTRKNIMKS